MSQERTINLRDVNIPNSKLLRIQKGFTLHFKFDASLGVLYTNYPDNGSCFQRERFHALENISLNSDDYFSTITVTVAGVFQFYIQKGNSESNSEGTFLVDPILTGKNNDVLGLDGIVLQTVLTKCLGKFSQWKKRLLVTINSGYNMVHFTPVQSLGQSNSCYSIKNHLKFDANISEDLTELDLALFVDEMRTQYGVFSISDVVWNHTANDCDWIQNHPEAAYNLANSPHLKPAFIVDRALHYFNRDIISGKYRSLLSTISCEEDLNVLKGILSGILKHLNLERYYLLSVSNLVESFARFCEKQAGFSPVIKDDAALCIIQDASYNVDGCSVDFEIAYMKCFQKCGKYQAGNVQHYTNMFEKTLNELNEMKAVELDGMFKKLIGNVLGHIRYHFVDENGPHYKDVSETNSVSTRYFSFPFRDSSLEEEIAKMNDIGASIMAHNGWVMGGDALKNFAESDSNVYFLRELIAWGDSIKFRYGDKMEDSPFLWDVMKKYTEQMARIFHGFRIDNCHSTPMHVAKYLLDCARAVREDLYVVAELFTNSEVTDNIFINQLGLNSLIRENLNASSPRELGRLIHRYGGDPVGSFVQTSTTELQSFNAHALFMDATHDNPSLMEVRSVYDILPSAAIILAGCCATGSNRGYDELVPHHISVVNESRKYNSWCDESSKAGHVTMKDGIIKFKRALNLLHSTLQKDGFNQIFVDQRTEEVTVVTRHNPTLHESVLVIAHAAFDKNIPLNKRAIERVDVIVEGLIDEIVLEATLVDTGESYVRDSMFINGSSSHHIKMREHLKPDESEMCSVESSQDHEKIVLKNFLVGSVVVVKCSQRPAVQEAIIYLRDVISKQSTVTSFACLDDLHLTDFNIVLYQCDSEEREAVGMVTYDIPDYGKLVYAGLQGFVTVLSRISKENDLGHPLCENLRKGNWMMHYISLRLQKRSNTQSLGDWFVVVFEQLQSIPRYLVPAYFEAVISLVYEECLKRIYQKMSKFVQAGSTMVRQLALGCVQMCAVGGTSLMNVNMAAGLPHFSTGFMRCWGRDTFIALRGLLLVTGQNEMARTMILAFGGVLRHGLIPNLLAGGTHARYNARDATWFWLQAVQEYVNISEEGERILHSSVQKMFPNDDSEPTDSPQQVQLEDVIHEILQRHFEGIRFRERNAGVCLDEHMRDEGFDQDICVDIETGFIHGGNKWNCGTWMDKMGSSQKAGNKGVPATPRDGCAVEIVGLCHSALSWLIDLHRRGVYTHSEVRRTDETTGTVTVLTYLQWRNKIHEHFEKIFYVSEDCSEEFVNRRAIYKDTHASSRGYTDYQLRPNFPIAMCSSSDLFDTAHAWGALEMVEQYLLGQLGLATLDPEDWVYNGNYDNDCDTCDFGTAKGFNYHQGPEWIWVLGPFLRAKWIFAKKTGKDLVSIKRWILEVLSNHKQALSASDWSGLPELTNRNGVFCGHSCPTQAWSMACLLEVFYDLKEK